MNFQGYYFSLILSIALLTMILVSLIIFLLGIIITRWWAIEEGWTDTYKPSIIINSFWLSINIGISLFLIIINFTLLLAIGLAFIINLFIGSLIISNLYDKKYKKSLTFTLMILFALLIIYFIIYLIILVIIIIILLGL